LKNQRRNHIHKVKKATGIRPDSPIFLKSKIKTSPQNFVVDVLHKAGLAKNKLIKKLLTIAKKHKFAKMPEYYLPEFCLILPDNE
jgi:hypothetical protein